MSDYSDGDFKVTVEKNNETVLLFEGWAASTTDALYKALDQRQVEYEKEKEHES